MMLFVVDSSSDDDSSIVEDDSARSSRLPMSGAGSHHLRGAVESRPVAAPRSYVQPSGGSKMSPSSGGSAHGATAALNARVTPPATRQSGLHVCLSVSLSTLTRSQVILCSHAIQEALPCITF